MIHTITVFDTVFVLGVHSFLPQYTIRGNFVWGYTVSSLILREHSVWGTLYFPLDRVIVSHSPGKHCVHVGGSQLFPLII